MITSYKTKAAISVAEMCRLLEISRSQFYWHVERGTFLPPAYMIKNKRPFFTCELVEANLQAKETGIGVNGQYVIFYAKRKPATNCEVKKSSSKNGHTKLIASLKSLGIESVTATQVDSALAICFPSGTDSLDETDVVRAVFRHLKRSEGG